MANHYETLQVSRTASAAVIRASYKTLIQQYHPDRHSPREEAEHITKLLNEAYAVLRDPGLRAKYDAYLDELEAQESSSGPPADRSPPPPTASNVTPAAKGKLGMWWGHLLRFLVLFVALKIIGAFGVGVIACAMAVWSWKRASSLATRVGLTALAAAVGMTAWIGIAYVAISPTVSQKSAESTQQPPLNNMQATPNGYRCVDGTTYNSNTQFCEPSLEKASVKSTGNPPAYQCVVDMFDGKKRETCTPTATATVQPVNTPSAWEVAVANWRNANAEFLASDERRQVMADAIATLEKLHPEWSNEQLLTEAQALAFQQTNWPPIEKIPAAMPRTERQPRSRHHFPVVEAYVEPASYEPSSQPVVTRAPKRNYGTPARLPSWNAMKAQEEKQH